MSVQVMDTAPASVKPQIEYPESDGKPIGETEYHVVAALHLLGALRNWFRRQEDVYVIANMFMYYAEGNPGANKVPDVMVVKGVDRRKRRTFKTWEEGAVPAAIIEITSKSTQEEDTVRKSTLYASLGVREYYLFDPLCEFLDEQLWAFRLAERRYEPIPPDPDGGYHSEELGALLQPQDDLLRVVDPETGTPVPSLDEAIELAESEALRAEEEAARASAAEDETARLREELQRLQRK